MSKSWRENLKSQLKEKGITPEGSKTSESSTSSTSTTTINKTPRITTQKLQKQLDQLKKEITQLKKDLKQKEPKEEELAKDDVFKSHSILVKRMGITVLKQYQNNLTSPLAQDVQEFLSFLGYNPDQIIKEIKQSKRRK